MALGPYTQKLEERKGINMVLVKVCEQYGQVTLRIPYYPSTSAPCLVRGKIIQRKVLRMRPGRRVAGEEKLK